MTAAGNISIKKAAIINGVSKYAKIILSTVFSAILARILTPEDFGIVAVITVFSTFFTMLSDLGIGPAIVQEKSLGKREINSLFTYSIYIAASLTLIFLVLAFPVAWFYKDNIYIKPTALLSVALFFNAVNMVPNGILNREKKFVSIGIRTVVVYLVSAPIAILLALHGWRYYALIVQSILVALLTFIWNMATTKPNFLRHPDKEAILRIKSFSGYQFAFNLINYFARNLDNLLAGKFMGETNLGNYNKAYNLMLFPVNNLAGVISPVLHPILSDFQDRPAQIYSKYLRIVKFLFCCGIGVSALCYLASEEIIGILYGDQWKECVTCFKYLSIAIIPQMINSSAGAVFQALGNTKLLFKSCIVNTCLTIAAILFGILYGCSIQALALCVAISYIFHFFLAFIFLIKGGFHMSLPAFFKSLTPEFMMTAIMIAAIFLFRFEFENIVVSLLVKCIYIGVVWLLMMVVSKEYKIIISK